MENTFVQMTREEVGSFIRQLCKAFTSEKDIINELRSIGYEQDIIIRKGTETSGWTCIRTFFIVVLYQPNDMLSVDISIEILSHVDKSPT